jgi:polyhydroxyalkanoate synthesis regulator phasin
MAKLLEKITLATLGALSLTEKRAKKLVDSLIKEGELSQGEATRIVKEAMKQIKEKEQAMKMLIKKTVQEVIKELDIPTRNELEQIKKEMTNWFKKKN